jgi:hypothetical protein
MKKVFQVRRTCAARASAAGRGSTGSSRGADRRVELKGTCDMCSAEEHVNVWKAPSQRLSAAERDVNERGSQKRTRGGMTRSPWYKGRLDTLDVSPNQLGFQEADRTPYKEAADHGYNTQIASSTPPSTQGRRRIQGTCGRCGSPLWPGKRPF